MPPVVIRVFSPGGATPALLIKETFFAFPNDKSRFFPLKI